MIHSHVFTKCIIYGFLCCFHNCGHVGICYLEQSEACSQAGHSHLLRQLSHTYSEPQGSISQSFCRSVSPRSLPLSPSLTLSLSQAEFSDFQCCVCQLFSNSKSVVFSPAHSSGDFQLAFPASQMLLKGSPNVCFTLLSMRLRTLKGSLCFSVTY